MAAKKRRQTRLRRHMLGRQERRHTIIALGQSPEILAASQAWLGHRAYVDNAGNYRVREGLQGNGKIAPWNRSVKAKLAAVGADLHEVAHALFRPARSQTDFERMHAIPAEYKRRNR